MNLIFKRIKTRIMFAVGADKLNKEFLQFAAMHLMYILATSITMTFVNTLLMRVAADPDTIALKYNIVHFIFVGLSMTWAAMLMKKVSNKAIILYGISLSMLTYLLTFVFMSSLDKVYAIVAAVHGIATGFYWLIYFDCVLMYTQDETRDIAMSFIGVFSGIISLVMPSVSGFAIQTFPGFSGYYVVFGVCFAVAGFAVYLVTRLPVIEPTKGKTQFRTMLKNVYTKKVWFFVIHMDFFKGIREGAFSFFLNVLLFKIVQSEGLVGINSTLAGITSMLSCIVAGKIMRPNNRMKLMFLGTTILTALAGLLFFELNTFTILMLSIASSFLGVFVVNPTTTTMYTVLDNVPNAKDIKTEMISTSECFKNTGRILGVILIMVLPQTNFFYVLSLVILTVTQYITIMMAKTTLKCVKQYM
jgi:YQGE family putative transporter